jgi:hypothetical protein
MYIHQKNFLDYDRTYKRKPPQASNKSEMMDLL